MNQALLDGLTCNFDKKNLCKWLNDRTRGFEDWIVNKAEHEGLTETQFFFKKLTSSFQTGPQNGDRLGDKSETFRKLEM